MNNKGFTLTEILMAVLIMVLLVAMAVPIYEKTIEKSRLVDARTTLKRIYDSKIRILGNMDTNAYNTTTPPFGFENLDFAFSCTPKATSNGHVTRCNTEDFTFQIYIDVANYTNGVCAARRKGDNAGVAFLYTGEQFVNEQNFLCKEPTNSSAYCDEYGVQQIPAGDLASATCPVEN